MIVVVTLSVLAALVVPMYQNYQTEARASAMVANLRILKEAFDRTVVETGTLPTSPALQQYPTLLDGRLSEEQYSKLAEPVGGQSYGIYNGWVSGPCHYYYYTAPTSTAAVSQEMDNTIDDGAPTAGWFWHISWSGNIYNIYILSRP